MDQPKWRRTDESTHLYHFPNHQEFYLYYGRIYTSGLGYSHSCTNRLILNLKKSPHASEPELHYKALAIQKFAEEVISLFSHFKPESSFTLVPMPPSKAKSHLDYDDRLEQVAAIVASQLTNVSVLPILLTCQSSEGYHTNSISRNPNEIYKLMGIDENCKPCDQEGKILAVIDDVLTSGAHFSAAQRHLQETFPESRIIGIFWAKAESFEV